MLPHEKIARVSGVWGWGTIGTIGGFSGAFCPYMENGDRRRGGENTPFKKNRRIVFPEIGGNEGQGGGYENVGHPLVLTKTSTERGFKRTQSPRGLHPPGRGLFGPSP